MIILIVGISCNLTDKKIAENGTDKNQMILDSIFDVEKLNANLSYQPLSLNFKGSPIFSIGQKLTEIDSTLSYRIDPNLDYQDYFPLILDYIKTEDKLSLHKIGKHSYVSGILYFSADQKLEKIFNVSGNWGFQVYDNGILEEMEVWLTENLFPDLKNKFEFKDNWNYEIKSLNQVEYFELNQKQESWHLKYNVELK